MPQQQSRVFAARPHGPQKHLIPGTLQKFASSSVEKTWSLLIASNMLINRDINDDEEYSTSLVQKNIKLIH